MLDVKPKGYNSVKNIDNSSSDIFKFYFYDIVFFNLIRFVFKVVKIHK